MGPGVDVVVVYVVLVVVVVEEWHSALSRDLFFFGEWLAHLEGRRRGICGQWMRWKKELVMV